MSIEENDEKEVIGLAEHHYGHGCHCHDVQSFNQEESQEEEEKELVKSISRLIGGILLGGLGLIIAKFANDGTLSLDYLFQSFNPFYYLGLILILVGYIVLLLPTIKGAILELKEEHSLEEEFLVSISCLGAFFIGSYFEGLMVAILYEIGELLQDRAVDNLEKI